MYNLAMNKHYNLIIIGSGPAGLSTALHLEADARGRGLDTLILEKSRHPRPKLCAGGILIEGQRILSKLNLNLSEVSLVDVDHAFFNYEGRGLRARFLNKSPIFRVVRRDEFDAWLAEKAKARGIAIEEGVTVKKITPTDKFVLVETDQGEYRSEVVVGADGSNSIVRRAVAQNSPPHVGRALEVITPLTASPKMKNLKQDEASFDFLAVPQGISGYVWDFPARVKGEPMRCWGIYDSNIVKRETRLPLRQILAAEMTAHGYNLDDYELKGHPIRWYASSSPPAMPRVLLVGDALGVDALLGEGISPALGYGRVAADEILRAFEKKDFSFQGYHRRLLGSRLGGALWRRTFIAKLFYRFKRARLQRIIWQKFGWLAGLLGILFVTGWEKEK